MDSRELGYVGAARAADHADRSDPLWRKIGHCRLLEYLLFLRDEDGVPHTFTAEDFRAWAIAHSLPEPPDPRAFGNLVARAAKSGLIRDSGKRVRTSNRRAHGREVVLWEVA